MESYDAANRLEYIMRMMEKFEANPSPVIVFLQEEQVPEEVRGELEQHLKAVCLLTGTAHFLRQRLEREDYLVEMADKFEADPKDVEKFLDEQRVPDNLRDELRRILKTILMLRGTARTIRKAAKAAGMNI